MHDHQTLDQILTVDVLIDLQREKHLLIVFRIGARIDAGNRSHHDDISSLQQGVIGRHAQHIDLVIGHRIFLDVGIGLGHIGFRLIKIEVGNKVFHRILRKQCLKLRIQLTCQGLIVGKDQGWLIDLFNHIGDGEGLAGTGGTQKDLFVLASF